MPILVDTASVESFGPGVPGASIHPGEVALGDITFGTTDEYGVEWVLSSLSGWSDSPGSTGSVEQRASNHGGWIGPAHLTPRVLEIKGTLLASDWDGASRALKRLTAAIPLSVPQDIYVNDGYQVQQAKVRQEGDPLTERLEGWARFSLSLLAPDPRKYSADLVTLETGLPSTSGGLSLPLSLPLSISATVTSGILSATNEGNFGTRPTFVVHGPVDPFRITHRGQGRVIRFHEAIPAGRFVLIDTDKKTALLDGTAARRITGTWFEYEGISPSNPSGLNEVSFSADSYDPAARLVSEHRHADR